MSSKRYGGKWSKDKLSVLGEYFRTYTTALKNMPFKTVYVDAFAGSGMHPTDRDPVEGSALMALKCVPPFDRYIFIEKGRENFALLQKRIEDFRREAGERFNSEVSCVCADANASLAHLAAPERRWDPHMRFLILIDPYGLTLRWETLASLKNIKADIWYLFPAGGVNRVMTRDWKGIRNENKAKKLKEKLYEVLGSGWEELYRKDLLGIEVRSPDSGLARIQAFFMRKLKKEFRGQVLEGPVELLNSRASTQFFLYFICTNTDTKAWDLARKLAKCITDERKKQQSHQTRRVNLK